MLRRKREGSYFLRSIDSRTKHIQRSGGRVLEGSSANFTKTTTTGKKISTSRPRREPPRPDARERRGEMKKRPKTTRRAAKRFSTGLRAHVSTGTLIYPLHASSFYLNVVLPPSSREKRCAAGWHF